MDGRVTIEWKTSPLQFKIDTGSDLTAISEEIFKKLDGVTLRETITSLHGPVKYQLIGQGQFAGMLTYEQSNMCQEIFVVHKLGQAPQWPLGNQQV